ncbi:hypothetical protein AB0H86_19835 [Streptomyces sp. NPDC050997]|uniref:hypothetical protein n=1 Tax=Streptomyces sp. NPDC050997 TaxID=3155519 RepID=UPI00341ADB65
MTTVTLPTVPPPPESRAGADHRLPLPLPGRYTVDPCRSLTELTAWYGPLPTLRRRVALAGASLTVPADTEATEPAEQGEHAAYTAYTERAERAEDAEHSEHAVGRQHPCFRFEFGGRHLTAALTSEHVEETPGRLQLTGDLDVNGVAFPVLLRLRVVERSDDRLLVVGRARLPYRLLRRATGFRLPWRRPATRLRLLVAAEFA